MGWLRIFVLTGFVALSGCMSMDLEKVSDYSNRSIVYGWLDISQVDGNRVYEVIFHQSRPATKRPYIYTAVEKFKGGFLYYYFGFPNGAFKLEQASAQSCLLFLCGNSYYTYSFGKQGDDVGTLVINKPDVYYTGSYAFKEVKTGWFQQSKFDVAKATNAPSQREMLEFMAQDSEAKEHPEVAARIKQALQ